MYDRLLSVNPKVSVIHRSALTDWMRMKHRCRERFTNIKTSEHELHRIPCLGFEASVRITCEYLKLSRLVVIIHLEYSGVVIVWLDAFKTSQVKWWASELWAVVDTMGWAGARHSPVIRNAPSLGFIALIRLHFWLFFLLQPFQNIFPWGVNHHDDGGSFKTMKHLDREENRQLPPFQSQIQGLFITYLDTVHIFKMMISRHCIESDVFVT